MDQYFGTYQTFETSSKKEAAVLLGADNLVGDTYDISIELAGDTHKAWLINRFDQRIGFFNPEFSRALSIRKAQGLDMKAILSFVAYTDNPEPGYYWGEMGVICFNPSHKATFDTFIANIAKRMSEGIRVRIDLESEGVNKVISSHGEWTPEQTTALPNLEKGSALMKSKRSLSEKMIEQGRAGNKGCYFVSWAFILGVIVLAIFGLKSCGGF